MTIEYRSAADPTASDAARTTLDHLMAWVGVDGLVAALRSPALLAVVDQYAAEARDLLGARVTDPCALAEYAHGVHAPAVQAGRRLPDPGRLDWSRAPGYLLRLVAVCALAGAADCC